MEEVIGKLKHCYEQSKCKSEPKHDWKGNEKAKGKWPLKQEKPQDAGEKENVASYNMSSATEKGHSPQLRENKNKGSGREPLHCWIYGKDHRKKYFPLYQGAKPHIYNA